MDRFGRADRARLVLALVVGLSLAACLLGTPTAGPAAPAPEGVAAPPQVVQQLRAALAEATRRFEARDAAGVLTHVSDQYRTGPFTKAGVREQLTILYGLYDAVRATVRIDEVRMVGPHAWVYSTGELSGRLSYVGRWVSVLSWRGELEVARLENGVWRLYGYQQ